MSTQHKLTVLRWYVAPILLQNLGRNIAALLAIAAGIGLATAIHAINQTAVGEFQSALARVNGAAQLQVRGQLALFDEAVLDTVLLQTAVMEASPVLDINTSMASQSLNRHSEKDSDTAKKAIQPGIKIIGVDFFRAARVTPDLLARPVTPAAEQTTANPFSSDAIYIGKPITNTHETDVVLTTAAAPKRYQIAGWVNLNDGNRYVLDLANAQRDFGYVGKLSRIDILLTPGVDITSFRTELQNKLPASVRVVVPDDESKRMSNLSRAYRVNLTVLALVALVTGALIVFSTQGAMVLKQWSQLALLSLLGASRRWIFFAVLAQGVILAIVGTALGILLGWALAAVLLQTIGTDLGGGYFSGKTALPSLNLLEVAVLASVGLATGIAASWLPARAALNTRSADALKPGHGERTLGARAVVWPAIGLAVLGLVLSFMPAIAGLPFAGYAAIACWLFAGVAAVPWIVTGLLARAARALSGYTWRLPALWLALQRVGQSPGLAIQAIAGVVASMALVTAMAIMVTSFRGSVANWLDQVLPADLYARFQVGTVSGFSPADQATINALPFVLKAEFSRSFEISLSRDTLPVAILARPINREVPAQTLPITGSVQLLSNNDVNAGLIPIYVSEAMVSLHNMQIGSVHSLRLPDTEQPVACKVVAVWRDYARQTGTVQMHLEDFRRRSPDQRANDVSIWYQPNTNTTEAQATLAKLDFGGKPLEWRSSEQIRKLSLTIFDRSFAVTYALEAAAILVALIGVSASFSAQVLARQREFGVMHHVGVSPKTMNRQLLLEGGLLTLVGALWGSALGFAMAWVLVHRVNPQSFHWTMDVSIPWLALIAGVITISVCAAWFARWSARHASHGQALLSVRQDW